MDCPQCGQNGVDGPACFRCGVVFAKLRPASPRPRSARPGALPAAGPPTSSGRALVLPALGLIAVVAVAAWRLRAPVPGPAVPPSLVALDRPPSDRAAALPSPPPIVLPSSAPATPAPLPVEDLRRASQEMPEADRLAIDTLLRKLQTAASIGPPDVQSAERLFLGYPGERPARNLLEGVVMAAARQARARRDHAGAAADLRRAANLLPSSTVLRSSLLAVLLEAGDWAGAEAAGRDLLSLAPDDADAVRSLAYALVRQDRNREAAEILRSALDRREDPALRALLAQVQAALRSEGAMTERRLAYFNVRYDGEAHEDVGREILRVLERHRATLVRTFDYEPATTIPVILFTQRGYYDATGAPAWAGGHYDTFDGRIRIPIGGLTTALTPDMDGTLIHELTHAFIADRSRGVAPREIHEGVAQLLEGKRLSSMLDRGQLQALADGRVAGVAAFYLGALSFVEFLVGERGQGGINDLLQAMGDSGDVEAAFQKVYGRGSARVKGDWAARLKNEHGS